MKNLFIMTLLLALPGIAWSQSGPLPVKRHELGINLFSAQFFAYGYSNRFVLPGVFYRQYHGKNVIRASMEVRQKFYDTGKIETKEVNKVISATYVAGGDSSYWKRNVFDLRIGYERLFGKHEWMHPYVFSELGGQLTQTDGWYMRRSNPVDTVRQPLNSRIVAIGLTVGAGIRLEFWRTLAVCFETDFFASVNYYRHKKNTGIETGKYGDFDFNQVRTLGVSCRF